MNDSFSRRHGFRGSPAPITVREDAPPGLRAAVLQIAREVGMAPSTMRECICRILRCFPDPGNWSEYPNVWQEVQGLIEGCEWFRVYDIAEAFFESLAHGQQRHASAAASFEAKLNEVFIEDGIGWQMTNGAIQVRGPESFERAVRGAQSHLQASGRRTAATEIAEALRDLSRRPHPDRTGAIQHGMAGLECVARDFCGDPKATLGDLLKKHRGVLAIPPPLDIALEKIWGYASEVGRHVREGREPAADEAELVVTLSAAVISFLLGREGSGTP